MYNHFQPDVYILSFVSGIEIIYNAIVNKSKIDQMDM